MQNAVETMADHQADLAETAIYAQEWITNAIAIMKNQPVVLRGSQPNTAFETLAASVDGLDWLHQFAEAAHTLGKIEKIDQDSSFSIFGRELLILTSEFIDAMEACDTMLLADLVEHELVPLLNRLHQATDELIV